METRCDNVTDTICRIQSFVDCTQTTKSVQFQTTEIVTNGQYVPYECVEKTRLQPHKKLVPVCQNVTRQDCVTKWEIGPNGQKVGQG